MISIWLDDERDPTDPFVQAEFGACGDEVWVKTVQEAETLLMNRKVSKISLDNDLGPVEAGEGWQVAYFIEKLAAVSDDRVPGAVRIHSRNPVARRRMEAAILSAERIIGKSLLVLY